MTKKIISILFTVLLFSACNSNKDKPSTALDTGRAFIRATLNGDFKDAETLLYKDTMNIQLFDSYQSFYKRLPEINKQHYKQSDYTINKYEDIDDSTTIINYSNSYMQKPMEIKVVRKEGEWQIDFKYTSSGNLPIN